MVGVTIKLKRSLECKYCIKLSGITHLYSFTAFSRKSELRVLRTKGKTEKRKGMIWFMGREKLGVITGV